MIDTGKASVARPLRVGVLDVEEAKDLVGALAVRGFVGRPLERAGGVWVELHEAREEADRLLSEVIDTVSAWASDRQKDTVEVHADGAVYTIRLRPQELGNALGARLIEVVERHHATP